MDLDGLGSRPRPVVADDALARRLARRDRGEPDGVAASGA